jgi:hypothetical protein
MNAIQKWGIWLLVTASAVTVSYFWLDRPIALFVHRSLQGFDAFALLTYIPNVVMPAILIAFVAVGLSGLSSRSMGRLPTVAVLAAASLAIADRSTSNMLLAGPGRKPGPATILPSSATASTASTRSTVARDMLRFPPATLRRFAP